MQSQITRFPVIKPFVRTINRDVKKFGLQQAMMNTVTRSKSKLIVKGRTDKVNHVLKDESVVVVANHPHEVDIIALFAALPPRESSSLIISSRFMNLAPNADKYLIPVYVEHHVDIQKGEKLREKFLKKFHPVPTYSPAQEHKKNIESINNAARKVSEGGSVVIFPNPSKDENKKWYSGVGYLLHGIKTKKKVYVVRAYIEGTSNFDYLRFIPHAAKLLTPIKVTFAPPLEVSELIKQEPKTVVRKIEASYKTWVNKLKKDRSS